MMVQLRMEASTMTTPGTALQDEMRELIEVQIETFGQPSRLTASDLLDYSRRAERIKQLGQELDRIGKAAVLEQRFGRVA